MYLIFIIFLSTSLNISTIGIKDFLLYTSLDDALSEYDFPKSNQKIWISDLTFTRCSSFLNLTAKQSLIRIRLLFFGSAPKMEMASSEEKYDCSYVL